MSFADEFVSGMRVLASDRKSSEDFSFTTLPKTVLIKRTSFEGPSRETSMSSVDLRRTMKTPRQIISLRSLKVLCGECGKIKVIPHECKPEKRVQKLD